MKDGTAVQGTHSRAQSKDIVNSNIGGALRTMQSLSPDFCLLQEVDTKATRSFGIDEAAMIRAAMPGYASVYASNFHSAFLAYPLQEMHGSVQAGLLTLSRYEIDEAVRRSYPVDNSFPTKFFDLDRCFSVQRLPVEGGKQLVLINSHMRFIVVLPAMLFFFVPAICVPPFPGLLQRRADRGQNQIRVGRLAAGRQQLRRPQHLQAGVFLQRLAQRRNARAAAAQHHLAQVVVAVFVAVIVDRLHDRDDDGDEDGDDGNDDQHFHQREAFLLVPERVQFL